MKFLLKKLFRLASLDISISSKAEKQYKSLPKERQEDIRQAFSSLKEDGFTSIVDIKKLKG